MPKSFGFTSYGGGFSELASRVLTMNIQGHIAQWVVVGAAVFLAFGLKPDNPRPRQRVTQVLLIAFAAWSIVTVPLVLLLPPYSTVTYTITALMTLTHIAVGVVAGILVARQRLIEGWGRWLWLMLAVSHVIPVVLGAVAGAMPDLMMSSLFITVFIQGIPWTHFIVGVLLVIAGVTSWVRAPKPDAEAHESESDIVDA